MIQNLPSHQKLFVKQAFEIAEIFGFESRNKYRVFDQTERDLAFVAEQQKGFFGAIMRQFVGHWRTFDLHFFGADRQPFMVAHHPFRWFFQRLEVTDVQGRYLGAIERRFAILSKKFDVLNASGQVILEVSSPIWRIWTFPFVGRGREQARISKKWSGVLSEVFTDRDNFLIEYYDADLDADARALVLAAAIYVDLMFFERKGNGRATGIVDMITD